MTTTEDIRRYLDAHGIDGAQAEPGWCAVEFRGGEVGIVHCDGRGNWGGAGAAPCVEVGFINGETTAVTRDRLRRCGEFYSSDIIRHVPLTLAPPSIPDALRMRRGTGSDCEYCCDELSRCVRDGCRRCCRCLTPLPVSE